jgi:hypothetical protein
MDAEQQEYDGDKQLVDPALPKHDERNDNRELGEERPL